MALGSGNQDQTKVPEEIQEYYQTERRERAGVAWLLAFGTLIITIVVATGIFFAGRWGYRQIAGNDEPETTDIAQEETQEEQPSVNTPEEDESTEPESPGTDAQEPEESPAPEEEPAGETPDETTAPDETAAPVTGDDTDDSSVAGTATEGTIPDTGPGNMAATFATVSLLGYLAHRLYARSQYAKN